MRRLVWASWPPVLLFGAMGWLRYVTLHNQTFDLAFYARMAHGLAHGDLYDPVVGGHLLGLHVSPVLLPLGLLGRLVGQVPVLLLAQTLSAGLAAQALAELGARRLGPWGALAGLALTLHPNLGHVLSYEFHPGTLALAPLVWTLSALDRGDARALGGATLLVLACREDLAAITALTGLLALATTRTSSPALVAMGRVVLVGSLLWLALWVGVVIPRFAPPGGSLDAHFGHLGGSFVSACLAPFTQPADVLAHLTRPEKLSYLPRLLAPLLFLPLLSPARALPALPVLAMLLLSQFPTTSELRSHYVTPALPALAWASIHGLARVRAVPRPGVGALALLALVAGYVVAGAGPLAMRFYPPYFTEDARTLAGREVLAAIPAGASVQAPYALLPHLAERQTLHRAPPPERAVQRWVLDVSHRERFARQGTLLRTAEEPSVRAFMARGDRGVRLYRPPFVLLERGLDPRAALAPFVDTTPAPAPAREAEPASPEALTGCLGVTHATASPEGGVRLHLVARGPCPSDLALRHGAAPPLEHVTLLFGGALSPAHLRAGDRVITDLPAPRPDDPAAALLVGALRSSGARPEPSDPLFVRVRYLVSAP